MLFIINNNSNIPINLLKYKTKLTAKKAIFLYKFNTADTQMNEYCIKKYNKPLRLLCLELIKKATFSSNLEDDLIITFANPKDDMLASLITYGNSEVYGSKILKAALNF